MENTLFRKIPQEQVREEIDQLEEAFKQPVAGEHERNAELTDQLANMGERFTQTEPEIPEVEPQTDRWGKLTKAFKSTRDAVVKTNMAVMGTLDVSKNKKPRLSKLLSPLTDAAIIAKNSLGSPEKLEKLANKTRQVVGNVTLLKAGVTVLTVAAGSYAAAKGNEIPPGLDGSNFNPNTIAHYGGDDAGLSVEGINSSDHNTALGFPDSNTDQSSNMEFISSTTDMTTPEQEPPADDITITLDQPGDTIEGSFREELIQHHGWNEDDTHSPQFHNLLYGDNGLLETEGVGVAEHGDAPGPRGLDIHQQVGDSYSASAEDIDAAHRELHPETTAPSADDTTDAAEAETDSATPQAEEDTSTAEAPIDDSNERSLQQIATDKIPDWWPFAAGVTGVAGMGLLANRYRGRRKNSRQTTNGTATPTPAPAEPTPPPEEPLAPSSPQEEPPKPGDGDPKPTGGHPQSPTEEGPAGVSKRRIREKKPDGPNAGPQAASAEAAPDSLPSERNTGLDRMLDDYLSMYRNDSDVWVELMNVQIQAGVMLKKYGNFHPYDDLTMVTLGEKDFDELNQYDPSITSKGLRPGKWMEIGSIETPGGNRPVVFQFIDSAGAVEFLKLKPVEEPNDNDEEPESGS